MPMAEFEDIASSKSLRSDIRAHISELDARILALEESLAVARSERENLQSRLDHNYSYPILTLPVEITSEIFIAFLPAYPERPPITGLLSPASLGQICRNWREIAFNTPWLWRAIKIQLGNGSSLDAQLNLLTTWLSRSKNCPLSVSFETAIDFTSMQLPHFTAALLSHSAHWEHIRLIIPFDDLRWLDGPFPLLRDLTFGTSDPPERGGETVTTLFRDAPQLKSIVLCVMYIPFQVVLPWAQLTSISAQMLEPEVAADILRDATALVEFTCTLMEDDIVPDFVPPLVHLQSLILRDDGIDSDPQKLLLDALTAPALRHLSISERELGHEPISTIAAFLSRSDCYSSLQSLHVSKAKLPAIVYRVAFPFISISVERVREGEASENA